MCADMPADPSKIVCWLSVYAATLLSAKEMCNIYERVSQLQQLVHLAWKIDGDMIFPQAPFFVAPYGHLSFKLF